MKVKTGTYVLLFVSVVLMLLCAWKSYTGLESLRKEKHAQAIGSTETVGAQSGEIVQSSSKSDSNVERDFVMGWCAATVLVAVFFVWRCYRFTEEKKTIEFLMKEKRKEEEIARRVEWAKEQKLKVQERQVGSNAQNGDYVLWYER